MGQHRMTFAKGVGGGGNVRGWEAFISITKVMEVAENIRLKSQVCLQKIITRMVTWGGGGGGGESVQTWHIDIILIASL